jgi:hypothetical protein
MQDAEVELSDSMKLLGQVQVVEPGEDEGQSRQRRLAGFKTSPWLHTESNTRSMPTTDRPLAEDTPISIVVLVFCCGVNEASSVLKLGLLGMEDTITCSPPMAIVMLPDGIGAKEVFAVTPTATLTETLEKGSLSAGKAISCLATRHLVPDPPITENWCKNATCKIYLPIKTQATNVRVISDHDRL